MAKTSNTQKSLSPLSYEWIFVIVAFIFGMMFVYQNPPFHSNDEDRHFERAYSIAHSGLYPKLNSDSTKIGFETPKNLSAVVQRFQGVNYMQGQKINRNTVEELSKVPLNPNTTEFRHVHNYGKSFWSYLPHAAGIKLAGDANPVSLGYAGRIGGLIFYIICMFFIIKSSPVFKSVFLLFGIMPMTLYQVSSVTYDTLLIVCSFAILSLFLRVTFSNNTKFSWKHLLLFFVFIFMMDMTKNGYILLPFVMLLIPKNKIKDGINPYLMYGLILVVCLLSWLNLDFYGTSVTLDLKQGLKEKYFFQRDFYKNGAMRTEEMLSDIPGTITNLWNNILYFRTEWLTGIFARFGYSYSVIPGDLFYMLNGLVLIAVSVLAGKKDFQIPTSKKYIIGAIGIINCLLLVAGFYRFSPIGAEMIFGFQGRYFLPMIPFILVMFYNSKIENNFWDKYGSIILGVYCFMMLGYTYSKMGAIFYAF